MAKTMKPTIETGAMTLVLLVKYYKSQMIALLLKNGVTVPSGASDQQIAMLMANLLKVSKSFFTDLNTFIQNPKVIQTLAGDITQNAQYYRMSGKGYMNAFGDLADIPTGIGFESQYGFDYDTPTTDSTPTTLTTSTTTPVKTGGFFSDLNLGNLLSQGLGAFASYDKNKTDRAIAEAKARLNRALTPAEITQIEEEVKVKEKEKDGTSTTTIVILSLVGIAVLGTIIYFVAKTKK